MKTVALIQSRMGSNRLPGKALLDLTGVPVLGWVVRAAREIPGVDAVTVATSVETGDDKIADWCADQGVAVYRGSETDVLARMCSAAQIQAADVVVRLTADCPLLDPDVCGQVLALLELTGADYATNAHPRRWPDGLDCEVVRFDALAEADLLARSSFDREHVTAFVRNHRQLFQVEFLACPVPGLGTRRWTLDTPDDLVRLRHLAGKLPPDRAPRWVEVLRAEDGSARTRPARRTVAKTGDEPSSSGRYDRSAALFDRAIRTIPTATQTFSKSHLLFPRGHAPLFLTHGLGGRVWDVDGNQYVDLVCGLLPVLLGYCDPDVDEAIARQMSSGITFSLATEAEAELAELLVQTIPCAEMVRFGKNGSDATSAAIRLARAFTGRDRIAVCGYHGWHDWYIGSTTRAKGVPSGVQATTHAFAPNSIDALIAVLESHKGEFAAVIMEPYVRDRPQPGYLESVRNYAHENGALLIFDEIITGFRLHTGGAQALFGVTPDLATFGKAMANGMPISAVVGKADVMREMDDIFFSGTFGGEALSIAAAIATIRKTERENVIERLWQTGEVLATHVRKEIDAACLSDTIQLAGLAPWMHVVVSEHPSVSAAAIRTVLRRALWDNGVLIGGSHNVCYAHDTTDIEHITNGYRVALDAVNRLLEQPQTGIRGPIIEPVFSPRTQA
jgi:glutamate-1-semialdehyde 2,1-aminomutase